MPSVIRVDGITYRWDPTKSTPDWPKSPAELGEIVARLREYAVKHVIDFGCGRGRNADILAQNFAKLYLVEVEKNMNLVEQWIDRHKYRHCIAMDSKAFSEAKIRVDACLLSFVIHTLPSYSMRRRVLITVKSKLRKGGLVVLISPAQDSKYREAHLIDAVERGDGVVRLYPDKTFSFYRNYDIKGLLALLLSVQLEMYERIAGDHRHIIFAGLKRSPK